MMVTQEWYEPVESYLESFRHFVSVSMICFFSHSSVVPNPDSRGAPVGLLELAAGLDPSQRADDEVALVGMREAAPPLVVEGKKQ